MPGTYKVSMSKRVDGVTTEIGAPAAFSAAVLSNSSLPAPDRNALQQFQRSVASLQRAVLGASQSVDELNNRIALMKKAMNEMQAPSAGLSRAVDTLEANLREVTRVLKGDRTLTSRNEPEVQSIVDLVNGIVDDQWQSSGAPTQTQRDAYERAADEFAPLLANLHTLVDTNLKGIENRMEGLGAPWTPGRVPEWRK
jgi:septal ring factor EnvC (AmiA/AmiB activator)